MSDTDNRSKPFPDLEDDEDKDLKRLFGDEAAVEEE